MLQKLKFSKNFNNKKCDPEMIFFNEKKIEKDSDNFWHRKLTLKVRNWQFSITWFRAGVDLPENLFYEKVLFFTQLSYHLTCKLLKKSYMLSNIYIMYVFMYYSLGFLRRQRKFDEFSHLNFHLPWNFTLWNSNFRGYFVKILRPS